MATHELYFPHPTLPNDSRNSAPITLKGRLPGRTVSISSGKPKPVRKSKASTLPQSCAWYEAEDRNLPSVSSF
ncbi:MAG: hypothetical protein M3O02_02880 [Acidobacteriota bacterium]|nr:hypothetical protein [Acidobacteriota bacterium]